MHPHINTYLLTKLQQLNSSSLLYKLRIKPADKNLHHMKEEELLKHPPQKLPTQLVPEKPENRLEPRNADGPFLPHKRVVLGTWSIKMSPTAPMGRGT